VGAGSDYGAAVLSLCAAARRDLGWGGNRAGHGVRRSDRERLGLEGIYPFGLIESVPSIVNRTACTDYGLGIDLGHQISIQWPMAHTPFIVISDSLDRDRAARIESGDDDFMTTHDLIRALDC
jgi:hypothetical protein